ncbi:MAG: glycosyltransferase [Undibacterium sp.]|nr:glycosyltransferase [Opitutaceae bacterium]
MGHALAEFPEVRWVVFAGPEQVWEIADPRVEVCRDFPANDRLAARLWADHFRVAAAARRRGAAALFTIGFVPLRAAGLPVAMQVITLHHRSGGTGGGGVGAWRAAYRAAALRSGLRRAALVIANSGWTAGQLQAAASGAAAKVITSYEGLDHSQFRPDAPAGEAERMRATLGVGMDYLLWSGNFYAYKQAEKLLAAYACLRAEQRAGFPLVMVGGDWNGGKPRAEALAAELGVAASVRFLGWVSDEWLAPLYRHARAHVLASAEETFGKSVPEAMACGCPCVVNDIAVLREVAGGAARVVDFNDAVAAGAALAELATDDELLAQLRAAGLRRAADFGYAQLARERVGAVLAVLEARG